MEIKFTCSSTTHLVTALLLIHPSTLDQVHLLLLPSSGHKFLPLHELPGGVLAALDLHTEVSWLNHSSCQISCSSMLYISKASFICLACPVMQFTAASSITDLSSSPISCTLPLAPALSFISHSPIMALETVP